MSEWYHPMHLDDIAVVEHQRGTRGKFFLLPRWLFGLRGISARPYWSGRHLAPSLCFTHTHMRKNCSPDVLAHAMICGRCWGLSIYFIKASYYTPMACGELCTCGLVPKQRRIKCRTWHWNRNLTAVSSGNLDLDLNSNKVFFFFPSQHKPDPSKNTPLCISAVILYWISFQIRGVILWVEVMYIDQLNDSDTAHVSDLRVVNNYLCQRLNQMA